MCVLIAYVVALCYLFVNTFPHGEECLDLNFFIVPHFWRISTFIFREKGPRV